MLVRVVLDCSLTVAVMHWQAVHAVIAFGPVATLCGMTSVKVIMLTIVVMILFRVHPVIWLPASHGVVSVSMH